MDPVLFFFLILFQGLVNCFAFGVQENFTSSRSAYFITRENKRLEGHVVKRLESASLISCSHLCLRNSWCTSTNFEAPSGDNGKGTCELNKHGAINTESEFYEQQGVTFSMLQKGCLLTGCLNGGSCVNDERKQNYLCLCTKGWTGEKCETKIAKGWYSHNAAHSCKDIRDSGDPKGDGEYWIDPENNGNPLKVYCDMTTDGGGWLLVSNIVLDNSSLFLNSSRSLQLSVKPSYRGIGSYHNNKTVLTKSAMNELWTHLSFTQIRFHCSKHAQQGRMFHVTTVANSIGEAVVQYFSGQTDVLPPSCNSFFKMDDDNSKAAKVCQDWGGEKKVGKWSGSGQNESRLYKYIVFVWYQYHWLIWPEGGRVECDDFKGAVTAGDFWKIYVR